MGIKTNEAAGNGTQRGENSLLPYNGPPIKCCFTLVTLAEAFWRVEH